MRVAHVITRLIIGGAQQNTVLCCDDLIRQFGDEVLLVTGPALGREGSLTEEARRRQVPIVEIDALRRRMHPWRDVLSYRALRRALADFAPDVVHTHSAKGGFLGRRAACSLGVRAIVHTVHGAPFHDYQNKLARWFFCQCERRAARWCHALVSVADAMTELMVGAGVANREMFTTIYSGMDVEPFLGADQHRRRVRRELGYEEHHIVVGKVARLFHLKGHDDVIESAQRAVSRHPNLRFLFVGDGILRHRLKKKIVDARLQNHFQFTGLVQPERVAEFMGAMDIVVHTSLREGLARVLPEALIAGRPVISYDIDGAREVVIDGVTGRLLAPRDVEGLADAMGWLAEDASRREQLGAEGRRRCQDVFRHDYMTSALRILYQQLLERE